jgi:hypothetical protein
MVFVASKLHIGLTLSCRRLRLLSDASTCFSKTDFSYCGNSRVEKHEECDSGQVEDKCCQDCKLNKCKQVPEDFDRVMKLRIMSIWLGMAMDSLKFC